MIVKCNWLVVPRHMIGIELNLDVPNEANDGQGSKLGAAPPPQLAEGGPLACI